MRQRQRCTVEILCTLWAVLGVKHRSHITGGWHNRLYIQQGHTFQTLRLGGLAAGRLATEALQERWQQGRQSLLMVCSGIDFSSWR